MFKGGETVVVGVSGGPDSTCLLDVLGRLGAGLDLVVCHVDHGLSAQSEEIATEVARNAAQAGHDVHVARAKDLAGPNLHARAREFRYSFFQTIAAQEGAACIATGHTLDDRVETTMARFIHGAGGSGLAGIPPVGGSALSHVTRVRPLIGVRRAETRAYCDEVGLDYVDDPSNEDPRFERAVVRQMVLKPIEDHWGDGAIRAMSHSVERIREDDDALAAQANILYAGMVEEGGPKEFDIPTLTKLPRALRRRLLEVAVGPKRDRGAGIDEVLDALERSDRKPDARFDLAGGTTVLFGKDKLTVLDSPPS